MKRIVSFVLVIALVAVLLPVGASAAGPEVAAKSAVLMDTTTGQVLYEHNAHEMLPPASVTKVMTLLLIMEAIDSGRIGWDDTVTASESAAAKGGSQVYLKVGETMTVTDMVKSIAVSSANDCACAMAEHLAGSESAFVDMRNKRAKELGMKVTCRRIRVEELVDIQEAAACGTACVISPLTKVVDPDNDVTYSFGDKPGPILTKLYHALQDIQYGRVEDTHGWCTEVTINK